MVLFSEVKLQKENIKAEKTHLLNMVRSSVKIPARIKMTI